MVRCDIQGIYNEFLKTSCRVQWGSAGVFGSGASAGPRYSDNELDGDILRTRERERGEGEKKGERKGEEERRRRNEMEA